MKPVLRCWAEIDLDALRRNVRIARSFLAAGVQVEVVVKANAYGHGLGEVASRLDSEIDWFGVANLAEALEIRATGARSPIVILSATLAEEREEIVEHGFVPIVSSPDEAEGFAGIARAGRPVAVQFKFDTGMGRLGLWEDEAEATLGVIRSRPELRLQAIASHLPVADDDAAYTEDQLARFEAARARFGLNTVPATVLNGAGIIRFGNRARSGDIVRVGLPFYGISPVPQYQERFSPALTWKTRVTLIKSLRPGQSVSYGRTFIAERPMRAAVLAAGYGDGYLRHLSNRGAEVLIGGVRRPLLGRVTMDQLIIDVTDLPELQLGAEAVLLGRQGTEEILASELAQKSGTIPWEIFTNISKRVTRLYRDGGVLGF
jgi:alanine racemase